MVKNRSSTPILIYFVLLKTKACKNITAPRAIIRYKKTNVLPLWVPFIRESMFTEGTNRKTIPMIRNDAKDNILFVRFN